MNSWTGSPRRYHCYDIESATIGDGITENAQGSWLMHKKHRDMHEAISHWHLMTSDPRTEGQLMLMLSANLPAFYIVRKYYDRSYKWRLVKGWL